MSSKMGLDKPCPCHVIHRYDSAHSKTTYNYLFIHLFIVYFIYIQTMFIDVKRQFIYFVENNIYLISMSFKPILFKDLVDFWIISLNFIPNFKRMTNSVLARKEKCILFPIFNHYDIYLIYWSSGKKLHANCLVFL